MVTLDPPWEQFIHRMPKVELHLHLEGAIRPATLLALARRHGVTLPADDPTSLARWFQYRDFPHFIEIWLAIVACLREPADLARITREVGEDLAEQAVRYAQVTFTPATHLKYNNLPYDEVWAGIREGANWVERTLGVQLQFVPDIPRNLRPGDDYTDTMVEFALAHHHEGIVGLGLGGYEVGNPPEPFAAIFAQAKAAGLRSWPHAGETDGPASIWGALRSLDADRIAHGIRAIEDPLLVRHLAEAGIACDVCPTSNVCLGVYPSLAAHPIRHLIDAGVPVTVNSDDPSLFGTSLTGEYLALARTQAFTARELADLVRTGLSVSFLPEAEKAALGTRIAAELAEVAQQVGLAL